MATFEHDITGSAFAATLSLPPTLLTRLFGGPVVVDGEPLQPATHAMLVLGQRLGLITDDEADVATRRREIRDSARIAMPRARRVNVTDMTVAGAEGRLSARRYQPWDADASLSPTIMYLHGGGWVVGDLDTHDALCRVVAIASACTVVSVDYRLAPEHPFPAAVHDCLAAFKDLRDTAATDGIPGAVAVMGDSAGGNLAAVVSIAMRDSGEAGPVAQGLLYPGTDLRLQSPSIDLFADGFYLSRADMHWYRHQYVPDPDDWNNVWVSPLLADDLRDLPPALVWTAGFDPLRDEGAAYADRLRSAGTAVGYRCFGDQIHGFASMGVLPGGLARAIAIGRQMGELSRAAV